MGVSEEDTENGETSDRLQLPSGSFDELALPEPLLEGLRKLGYTGPTPVQRETYGPVAAGQDVIVQAKTGSGKTSAFGIPILAHLGQSTGSVRGLILCPTRELAAQVARELTALSGPSGLRVLPIYGGAAFGPQLDALSTGVDVVVGTPGRLLDHMRRGNLKLGRVKFAVLDEADEMLSMGFWDEVTSILDQLRQPHQTLLFSATLPFAIQRAAARYLNDPQRIELSGDEITVSGIVNSYYTANESMPKPRNMLHLIEAEQPEAAIVFCNRRSETELVHSVLRRFGYSAGLLNSDLSQNQREAVMGAFRDRTLRLLVATDVAARGIDIFNLSHVFHYDLPDHSEVYIHRAGRTGRVGRRGTSTALVWGRSVARLREISERFELEFVERVLPSQEEVVELQTERVMKALLEASSEVEIGQYQALAEHLLGREEAAAAVAFLLRSYFAEVPDPSQDLGSQRPARPPMRSDPRGPRGGGRGGGRTGPGRGRGRGSGGPRS